MRQPNFVAALFIAGSGLACARLARPTPAFDSRQAQRAANQSLAQADTADFNAATWQLRFLDCMRGYGTSHANSKDEPVAVADDGLKDCHAPLDRYSAERTAAHRLRGEISSLGTADYYNVGALSTQRANADVLELVGRGRQAAMRAMLDSRP